MGGLDAVEYSTLAWLAVVVIPVCALVIARSRQWNLLAVGDEWAASRGLSTTAYTVLRLHRGLDSHRPGDIAHRAHRIRRTDRAARAAIEAGRGSSRAAAVLVSAGRGVSRRLRYTVANRDRADGNPRRRRDRARRRAVLHLAAALETEEPVAVILIGGGARSGKSRYALEKARAIEGDPRIHRDRASLAMKKWPSASRTIERSAAQEFPTMEEPHRTAARDIAEAKSTCIVVDCLTLWLSNIMFAQ